ncbi:MAG: type I CRISPR-associated protein Cas7 [Candidatus Nitrotoga sp.]
MHTQTSSRSARTVDPIVALVHPITRIAVVTEAEAEKQSGDNRTMGRKFTIPYGLYAAHGFVSSVLAKQTGFDEGDLELLWQALAQMFERTVPFRCTRRNDHARVICLQA